jgi:hypothetical protein
LAPKLRDFVRNKPSKVTLCRHSTVVLMAEATMQVSNQVVTLEISLMLTKVFPVRASIVPDRILCKNIGKQTSRISDLWSKDLRLLVIQISLDPQLTRDP